MLQKIIDGRTDLVIDYLSKGYEANLINDYGRSLISWCAYYGDLTAVKHLLNHGARLEDLGSNYDLNGAAFHGHWKLCQFLLEKGADPNYKLSPSGEVALHVCIKANNPVTNYIIKLLIHHGAEVNARTNPNQETGSFMRDAYTKGETPLHRAAAFGNEESIQLLLDAGASKSAEDINGESPLGWASWHCRPGKILALLAHGEHRIHPLHEVRIQKDHGVGWSGGMELNLLGNINLRK